MKLQSTEPLTLAECMAAVDIVGKLASLLATAQEEVAHLQSRCDAFERENLAYKMICRDQALALLKDPDEMLAEIEEEGHA